MILPSATSTEGYMITCETQPQFTTCTTRQIPDSSLIITSGLTEIISLLTEFDLKIPTCSSLPTMSCCILLLYSFTSSHHYLSFTKLGCIQTKSGRTQVFPSIFNETCLFLLWPVPPVSVDKDLETTSNLTAAV